MTRRQPLSLGILASGAGTNFDAIAKACEEGHLDAEIRVVICNRRDAAVLDKASARRIEAILIESSQYRSRQAFDAAIAKKLGERGVELVVMAGFDRIVTQALLSQFPDRVINIHPALLPAFKGVDAQRQAADYGVKLTGATVHLVDEQVDHGPIVVQAAVAVSDNDDAETIRQRILAQEHVIYPYAIQLFAEGRVRVEGRRARIIGEIAPSHGEALISPLIDQPTSPAGGSVEHGSGTKRLA